MSEIIPTKQVWIFANNKPCVSEDLKTTFNEKVFYGTWFCGEQKD